MASAEQDVQPTDIAIIGMACRFPDASDPDTFWERVREGREQLSRFTDDQLRSAGVAEKLIENDQYIPTTSLIDGPGDFDAAFFGITPREAEVMDPQHRLFLELCWHALEDAGLDPSRHDGDIGVFAGAARNTYLRNNIAPFLDASDNLDGSVRGLQADIGNYGDFLTTRVSYKLGLSGPSMNLQTACSTSLVAVHMACQSLITGESDVALAGGVAVLVPQVNGYLYEEGSISSADGHCRPFDADANGTVFGNGAGVVVLRRLEDALADDERVIAVIKGTAINNDGSDKMSYSAPSVNGQATAIAQALQVGDVDPRTIGYVEAHGTGTSLGDPIEIAALTSAFGLGRVEGPFCAVGAVKAQIGHLGAAAGIAGLIKAALAVYHGEIPPMVNFNRPNPRVQFDGSPFYVPVKATPWHGLRRAGVSSFGIGGTNAHAVLEQPPARTVTSVPAEVRPFVLSARTPEALDELRSAVADHLMTKPLASVDEVTRTLATGRFRFRHRVAVCADDLGRAAELLRAAKVPAFREAEAAELPVVFAFPGQGSQYVGMTRALYESDRVFRTEFDRCTSLLTPLLNRDLREVVFSDEDRSAELQDTRWTQPALFAVEYAVARSLMSAGVTPAAMIGHSVGEYVAACLAGVFSLEDAVKLIATRGELMSRTRPGAMVAVGLAEDVLRPMLPAGLDIAAINSATQCVVAGDVEAIERFEARLAAEEATHTRLKTTRAFHSALMDPMLDEFREVLVAVRFSAPRLRFVSNLTGAWADPVQVTTADYWVAHARRAVRFADGLKTVAAIGASVVVEAGPGRGLAGMFRALPATHRLAAVSPWVRGRSDASTTAEVVGDLWTYGAAVDWDTHFSAGQRGRAALPGYPFERTTYWIEPPRRGHEPVPAASLSWLRVPRWTPTPLPVLPAVRRRVLALVPDVAHPLVAALSTEHDVITATHKADPAEVLAALDEPVDVIVCAAADETAAADLRARAHHVLDNAFFPLLRFVRAIARQPHEGSLDVVVVHPDKDGQRPELALLTGPCKVLPQEYPDVRIAQVITSRPADVAAELRRVTAGSVISYLESGRAELHYEEIAADDTSSMWTANGSYLITGGLGGIGLALAEDAAAFRGVRLTLVHRSALPDEAEWADLVVAPGTPDRIRNRLAAVLRMRAAGAEVRCVRADVSDVDAMRGVRAEFGPFHGIVHAAGVPGGRLIEVLDREHVANVLRPKVEGTLVLDEVVADEHTAWMVLCSSMAAVFGGVGQTEYCSANAFLDAFARHRTARGLRTVSLGFDVWGDVGMAVDAASSHEPEPEKITHPLFSHRLATDASVSYRGELRPGRDWVLDEHRVGETGLLPGTGLIEYVHAAATLRLDAERVEITGLDLVRPFSVPANVTAEIDVRVTGSGTVTLTGRTPGGAWIEYAAATVAPITIEAEPDELVAFDDHRNSPGTAPTSDLLTFGPRWDNVVRSRRTGDDELLVECGLAEEFEGDLDEHALHPALLDTAAGAFVAELGNCVYLPMSYESIRVHRPMPSLVRSRIRRVSAADGLLRLNVHIQDEGGAGVLDIIGYTLREVDPTAMATQAEANHSLVSRGFGDLASLAFVAAERTAPGPGEIEIEVLATGLNFKEVLIATGMLDLGQPDFRFGLECAGVVAAVGAGVTSLAVGDPVMAIGTSCFSRYVTVRADLASPIPAGMTFSQAATIPVAFATAYDCLVNLGRLRQGERVLVHAAAGGVGLAAIQIAHHLGAEVFGTAGSPRKREYVANAGVTHVMDSRSLDFEHETVEAGGVDVVLNSLAGDRIAAGLRTLRPMGRFVEIGKRDVLAGTAVDLRLLERGISFSVYNPDVGSDAFVRSWREVIDLVRTGVLVPLPLREFDVSDVGGAFAHMTRGQHIGKVVVCRQGAGVTSTYSPSAEATDVITTATGLPSVHKALASGHPHVLITPRSVVSDTEFLVADHVLDALDDGRDVATHARPALEYSYAAPIGTTEEDLAAIWASLLGIDQVGRDDRFLDLGGDSLCATQVVARVRSRLDVRISPADVLSDQPLAVLAALIDAQRAHRDAPEAAVEVGII
ncbi:acyl transferase domain-containing protein [Lentzea atacamensis]|uniref:Phenolphthiocerol/phthiocerol polyketide synthase subunit E n=1 Tax=Lentzea atacamensis TaxID=531938 RepID=A0A316HHH5_9PSEU|nr:type I polyketide synthase [Lentzea atacamensis]PWK80669.1 acyl transferase domain-containing protein [Lentzea atacamensis]